MSYWQSRADQGRRPARRRCRRESLDAYVFDGLMDAGAAAAGSGDGSKAKAPVKAILRADLAAVRRGSVERGEVCEIAGYGPVPVAAARELLGEAFLTVVLSRGRDVVNVTHLGRQPTAHQQTALEWMQPECEVLGCSATSRLERDHRADWAETHHTRLDELDRLCHFHHRCKTVEGFRLEPGQGKRRMLAPGELAGTGPP